MSTFRTKITEEVSPSFSIAQLEQLQAQINPVESLVESVALVEPQIILIGEGSHGTHEFYENRIEMTKALIEKGLCHAVLIEGDLPDTTPIHRFVMGHPSTMTNANKQLQQTTIQQDDAVDQVFEGFERFPSWMWANRETRAFVQWLREHNLAKKDPSERCGIFGLDLYSMHKSIDCVLEFLHKVDPEMEGRVRQDYSTLGGLDPQTYGLLVARGLMKSCEEAAVQALLEVSAKTSQFAADLCAATADAQEGAGGQGGGQGQGKGGLHPVLAQGEAFVNELNAEVVVGAEAYYRAMFDPNTSSWNLRDSHFFLALEKVRHHLRQIKGGRVVGGQQDDGDVRVVVWAHNSHLGDARHTHLEQPPAAREHTLGQLAKQKYPFPLTLSVGQLCAGGTVCAADDWGEEHQFKPINNPLPGSYEAVLHALASHAGNKRFSLDLRNPHVRSSPLLSSPRLQRAIGVIYRPRTERQSHYYHCDLVQQFDALIFEDVTTPVAPLVDKEIPSEEPETYPSGL
jgi:erythromycin esterase-like protein